MKPWYSAIGATLLALTLLLGSGLAASAQALPDPAPDTPATQPFSQGWATQVSAGGAHTCAVTLTGGVQCWGRNTVGQLGDGTTRARGAPVAVLGLSERVGMVSVGGGHTCAVTASGGVQCWGANGNGQLGDGTTSARLAPVAVVGLSHGVQALSAGSNHTCALLDNGGVQCWGANGYGQLGDGTTTAHLTPGDVVGLTSGVQALVAGYDHTCAIDGAGGVQCWGNNDHGQLGDDTITRRLMPVAVVGLASGMQALAAGDNHTCAIDGAGGAKCWGHGSSGELGNGVFVERQRTPVDVVDLAPGVTALSAGGAHTCAVTASGGAKCWGRNMDGQVGVDSPASFIWRPTDVVGLPTGVTGIAAGYLHTCAALASGEAKCWGWNGDAQLGDGTTSTRRSPVAVWRLDYDCASVTEIPQAECQALVTLFRTTNGPLWQAHTDWLRTATPCSWQGVACEAGHVSQLNLPANNLVDALPAALGDLTGLQRLDLSANPLTGALPATLGQLTALHHLDLSANQLTGALPETLGNLQALQQLDLHSNAFHSPLPASMGNLSALQYLDLSHNYLSDFLFTQLQKLVALQHLDLSHNQLSGPLAYSTWPDAQLPALRYLDLSANQFSDDVPWWPHLTALQHIDLSQNAFFGPLPWQLDQLVNLRYVALHSNHLSGPIWSGWSRIGAHVTYTPTGATPPPGIYLDFSGNHLWGPLPAELGLNPAIMGLQLSGNQLSGVVPAALTDRAFYRLDLNYNLLTSPDPNWPDRRTQTRPPTDLRATVDAGVITLSWTMPTYISYNSDYEISYAPTPTGPFTVAGYPGDARRVDYRLPGLAAEATYYFRLRTISYPQSYYEHGTGWDAVFKHAYFQPNTLWSDFTPVVCVNCTPPALRLWLPLIGNAGG